MVLSTSHSCMCAGARVCGQARARTRHPQHAHPAPLQLPDFQGTQFTFNPPPGRRADAGPLAVLPTVSSARTWALQTGLCSNEPGEQLEQDAIPNFGCAYVRICLEETEGWRRCRSLHPAERSRHPCPPPCAVCAGSHARPWQLVHFPV